MIFSQLMVACILFLFRCKGIYLFIYENIIQKSFVTNVKKVTRITISYKNAIKIKHLSTKKFNILTKFNPKMAGEGVFNLTPTPLPSPVVFRKACLLKRGRNLVFLWLLILSWDTSFLNFIEFPQVVQNIWRNLRSILAHFHQFSSIFWILTLPTYKETNDVSL